MDDAALLAVFVSDEDDQSSSRFPSVQLFKNWLDSVREHVYVSSIVNLLPEYSLVTIILTTLDLDI